MIQKRTFPGINTDLPLAFANYVEGRSGEVITITYSGMSYTVWVRLSSKTLWEGILKEWRVIESDQMQGEEEICA